MHSLSRVAGVRKKDIQMIKHTKENTQKTLTRLAKTGTVSELPRIGEPRVTSAREKQYIRATHLRKFHSFLLSLQPLCNKKNLEDLGVVGRRMWSKML